MLYYFKKGKNEAEMPKKKRFVQCMEKVLTDRMSQKWFVKVRAGDFSPDDAPQLSRPIEIYSDQIETLIENNQCYTTQEIPTYSKYPNQ